MAGTDTAPLLLGLHGLCKRFGSVTALDGVDLELRAGEIHAIVGENGAGKSTLLKVLSGAERQDAGTVCLGARELPPVSSVNERWAEIHCVPQELELFGQLSVLENCFAVARLPRRRGWVSWRRARRRAGELLRLFGHAFPLPRPARLLPPPEQALLQLSGFLLEEPAVLALDEPTASLGDVEARRLFEILRGLRDRGVGVLYVSHRLGEVLALADRITVLRNGRRVWTRRREEVDEAAIVEAMVGERLERHFPPIEEAGDEVVLAVRGLSDRAGAFAGVDLELRRGEVLGLYGVVGSGRTELVEAIAGLRKHRGEARCLVASGVAYVPGDRLAAGNLPGRPLRENLTLSSLERDGGLLRVDRRRERERAAGLCERLAIRAPGLEVEIDLLSGGNQQKALVGRALAREPGVLLLDEPTRGVDVGARGEIHRLLAALAASGTAVLLAGSDLPELLGMCHRIAVIRDGRLVAVLDRGESSEEAVTRAALPAGRGVGEARVATAGGAARRGRGLLRLVEDRLAREAALVAAIAIIALLTAACHPGALSGRFLADLLASAAPLAVAAAGMALVIASGAIDLSVGSVLALAATASALWLGDGGSAAAALAIAAALGAAAGAVNALLDVAVRLPPIVATLGTMGILRGVFLEWTGGYWIELPETAQDLARDGPLGVPATAWIAAAFLLGLAALSRWRMEFREMLALGDNPRAARRHGVRGARARAVTYVVLGAAVGLAALLYTARFGRVQNNTGSGFELQVIAAAVIGGTNIAGGRGTVAGAALGALFLAVLGEVRSIWGIHERWQLMAVGALMLAVIAVERALGRLLGAEARP